MWQEHSRVSASDDAAAILCKHEPNTTELHLCEAPITAVNTGQKLDTLLVSWDIKLVCQLVLCVDMM